MKARRRTPVGVVGLVACTLIAAVATAGDASKGTNPYEKANNSWISIGGTVTSVSANAFLLDYGKGTITVEMDDGDRDADAYQLIHGDKVVVNGRIDDDFFQTTTIEASSVYVEKLGTYFWASSADEEDRYFFTTTMTPVVVASTFVQGTVTEVREHEFEIDTGVRTLTVDVGQMSDNPLDEEGYQRIREGDHVQVNGRMDESLFQGRELVADSVIKLYRG